MAQVFLWGGSSKARIVAAMVDEMGHRVSHIFDTYIEAPAFETDAVFSKHPKDLPGFIAACSHFVVCIGGEHGKARHLISEELVKRGLHPLSLCHKTSFFDIGGTQGQGLQMMPGALVHKFCKVGDYVILNSNATIDHEATIGQGVHVMGGAAIAGRVTIGNYATIGTNATVLPDRIIGEGAFVGAGAVVLKDVAPYTVVAGNPARVLRKTELRYDLSPFEGVPEGTFT